VKWIQAVQEKLEQERQLASDRGRSREQWKQKCETASARAEQAELLAQQRLEELEQAHTETTLVYDAAHHGFFQHCDVELAAHLRARRTALRHACVEAELITFARHESASARSGERLMGSSEVEDASFPLTNRKQISPDRCPNATPTLLLPVEPRWRPDVFEPLFLGCAISTAAPGLCCKNPLGWRVPGQAK